MTGFPQRRVAACMAALGAACLGLATAPASAVQLGQVDSFAAGLDGWHTGANSPVPVERLAGGGPGGDADPYLLLRATGEGGGGSRLVAIAGPQWTGDFTTAQVTALTMWLHNEGATDLSLRLWLRSPAGVSFSLQPVLLAAGSGWQAARFSLLPAALTGPAGQVLANVGELRLYHGLSAAFPDSDVAARLGVDNISAVPEPAAAGLLAAGLAGLGLWSLRRRAAIRPSTHQE